MPVVDGPHATKSEIGKAVTMLLQPVIKGGEVKAEMTDVHPMVTDLYEIVRHAVEVSRVKVHQLELTETKHKRLSRCLSYPG
eukprot:626935-Pyramimonas_sp.AAC.1